MPDAIPSTRGSDMMWWQWMVLGLLLLGAEMAVDAQFYLIFLGGSALIVGLLVAIGLTIPIWGQWVIFSILAVGNLLFFRSRVYSKIRGDIPDRFEGVDGEVALVEEEIAVGAVGSARLRGAIWQARNTGDGPIKAGSRAVVQSTEGLVLSIRGED